jgi:hypothetical protein
MLCGMLVVDPVDDVPQAVLLNDDLRDAGARKERF